MNNTLQMEFVPIKNFVLDKYDIKPNNYTLSMKNHKPANHRNFMVLRSVGKNKKQPDLFSFQQQIVRKININKQAPRPKTSLTRAYRKKNDQKQRNEIIQKQIQDEQLKLNVEINSARSLNRMDYITLVDTSNLKNRFPQRRTKKNRNQRWYQYCVSPSVENKFKNMYIANYQTFETIKTPPKDSFNRTKKFFYRNKSEKKSRNSVQKEYQNDITPWKTNFSQIYKI